jgi:hypothetical protein
MLARDNGHRAPSGDRESQHGPEDRMKREVTPTPTTLLTGAQPTSDEGGRQLAQ